MAQLAPDSALAPYVVGAKFRMALTFGYLT